MCYNSPIGGTNMARAIINGQSINYEIVGVKDFKLRTPALLLLV